MATHSEDDNQPISITGDTAQPPPTEIGEQSAKSHGSTGEGSGSAMAQLIQQEQSRVVPGSAEDNDGS